MYKTVTGSSSPNLIKKDAGPVRIEISDYKNVVEEVEADVVPHRATDSFARAQDPSSVALTGIDPDAEQPAEQQEDGLKLAYVEGYESGKREAVDSMNAELDEKLKELTARFESVVQAFNKDAERYRQDFERGIVTLSIAIAKRIVAREIEIDKDAVLTHTQEAIRKIIGVDKIKIHVNPADEEYIREHRTELGNYADTVKEIAVEADNKVEQGGCVIESELGNIDARISTQFQLIEESLLSLVKG